MLNTFTCVFEILVSKCKIICRFKISAKAGIQFINTGFRVKPGMTNKAKRFLIHYTSVLGRLTKALSTPPWSEDEYLLSSFFRDLFNESKSIGKSLNINIPEPVHYAGKQYFYPFALGILRILKKLTRGS